MSEKKIRNFPSGLISAYKPVFYILLNVISASGIVFANKIVFKTYDYHFTCALTWIHTGFTLLGMHLFLKFDIFQEKKLPQIKLVPLAIAYVGYIVLNNLSLRINTVGFYQVMKIAVAPTVLVLEFFLLHVIPKPKIIMSVGVVCFGIFFATVTDSQISGNLTGISVGVCATLSTAIYQIWAGSKQAELRASSTQLLHAYTPIATVFLGLLVPICEPMGWKTHAPGTLLGYKYTMPSVVAILVSAALGLLVSLSTFLVIGSTSSLTYNVVGHMKTVIILSGGCVFFGDVMPFKKFIGVSIAMAGIVWYTQIKLAGATQSLTSPRVHVEAIAQRRGSVGSGLNAEPSVLPVFNPYSQGNRS